MEVRLPEKLSDCLELAMIDLNLCEKDPLYNINMTVWHNVSCDARLIRAGKCSVCLAGSVMAKTLKAAQDRESHPSHYNVYNSLRLEALDDLRTGGVLSALQVLSDKEYPNIVDIPAADYEHHPQEFKFNMKEIVKLLREKGL